MRNQTLQTLSVIKKRIGNNRNNTISDILENNKGEVEYWVNKFNLKDEEALFFAASCICSIECSSEFDVEDLAKILEVDTLEILLYQKSLNSLIEKKLLTNSLKDCSGRHFRHNVKSAVEILNKNFVLHSSVGEHFS